MNRRVSRWAVLVAAMTLLATTFVTSGVSHGQTEGPPIPFTSFPVNDYGASIGFTADGRLIVGFLLEDPLGEDPTQIQLMYVYDTTNPENCNGAVWVIVIGADPDRNPVAGLERLRDCTAEGRELVDEPPVTAYEFNEGQWKLVVEMPIDLGDAFSPVALAATNCSTPAGGCNVGNSAVYDLADDWRKAMRCAGEEVTRLGTEHDDTIRGGPHAEVIRTGRGNDVVDGRGGGDLICLDEGNDVGNGGKGRDIILGGPGNDVLSGGKKSDTLMGGGGRDILEGGGGGDVLDGGASRDVLDGGSGTDILRGKSGRDTLTGGAGRNDLCNGNGGRDRFGDDHGCETSQSVP